MRARAHTHTHTHTYTYTFIKCVAGTVHKQIFINAKLRAEKAGQTTELTWRSLLRRRRYALEYCILPSNKTENKIKNKKVYSVDTNNKYCV